MGLKRLMPLRKRARQSQHGVVVETCKPDGSAAATIHLPNGRRVTVRNMVVNDHDGSTIRSDDSARSEVVAWTTSFRFFLRSFGNTSGVRDFVRYWASQGIKVFPLTSGGRPARDVYKGDDVYLWGAQFPEGAPPDAGRDLAASPHVALTWETAQPQSNGMAYRRDLDQRRANKADKLPYNHGSGYGNSEGRRLSAP